MARNFRWLILLIATILTFCPTTLQASDDDDAAKYVQAADADGERIWVRDDRRPSLYTQDFGDCMGSSLINVSRFDAAWYKDNMTVLFHLEGGTNVANDSLMSTSKMEHMRSLL